MTSDYPNLMLVGPMGAGKTSGSRFLEQLGYHRFPVAGEHKGGIRDIARRLWGDEAMQDREKLNGLSVIDDQWPGIWLDNVVKAMEECHCSPIVVDDVRREMEWWTLRERGFVAIRVVAPEQQRIDRLKVSGKWHNEEQLNGRWEHGLDLVTPDYTIENSDDFDEFTDELIRILNIERRRR